MSREKSQPTPQEIYSAAEACLPHLRPDLQERLAALLAEARAGQRRANRILDLTSQDPRASAWMQTALFGESADTLRGYEPLAGGGPAHVPANSRWVCPQCGFEWRVLRAGRPLPPCPRDGSALVRVTANPGEGGA